MKAVFHKRFAMLVRNQHCSAFRYAYDSRGDLAEGAVIKFDSHCFFRCSLLSLVCFYYTVIGCFVNPSAPQFPKELGISFGVDPVEENGEKIEDLVEDDLAVEFHDFDLVSVVSCMSLLYRYRQHCQALYSLIQKNYLKRGNTVRPRLDRVGLCL